MMIPYVIDNQKYKLSDILNAILEKHQGQSMDVVTAYRVSAWRTSYILTAALSEDSQPFAAGGMS
jgi:hypothetical protein